MPSPESSVGSFLAEAFQVQGLDFPPTAVVAYAYEIVSVCWQPIAISPFSLNSVLRFPAIDPRIKSLSVELPLRRMPIGVITLKNRTLSPAAQLFIDCAREIAKPFTKRKS